MMGDQCRHGTPDAYACRWCDEERSEEGVWFVASDDSTAVYRTETSALRVAVTRPDAVVGFCKWGDVLDSSPEQLDYLGGPNV